MDGQPRLAEALARVGEYSEDLIAAIEKFDNYTITDQRDAHTLCQTLARYPFLHRDERKERQGRSPLPMLLAFFQQVRNQEAFAILSEQGIPQLIRIFDQRASLPELGSSDLLFLLKILAMYRVREGTDRIIQAIREGYEPDGYLWSVILGQFRPDHPDSSYLVKALGDDLPKQAFVSVAFLDCANQLAIGGVVQRHPFDSEDGIALIEKWIQSSDPNEYSYACSAATGLPFLTHPARDRLLDRAGQHPDRSVQMEALWAQAKLGRPDAIEHLRRLCLDPGASATARAYLEELGLREAVPAEANEPDFQAVAEMSHWLAHPNEFGRPPDEVELYDTRVLFWPPTQDRRRLWLIKYRYRGEDRKADDIGVGMVGSVIFALFGEATADLVPEDIYALHCCWELEMNNDERKPEERSIRAGRELLAQDNEGFDEPDQ